MRHLRVSCDLQRRAVLGGFCMGEERVSGGLPAGRCRSSCPPSPHHGADGSPHWGRGALHCSLGWGERLWCTAPHPLGPSTHRAAALVTASLSLAAPPLQLPPGRAAWVLPVLCGCSLEEWGHRGGRGGQDKGQQGQRGWAIAQGSAGSCRRGGGATGTQRCHTAGTGQLHAQAAPCSAESPIHGIHLGWK